MAQSYEARWKQHKKDYEGATKKKKPAESMLSFFRKGTGIQACLKKYDAASDLDGKTKSYQNFYKAKEKYKTTLAKEAKAEKDATARKCIQELGVSLDKIQNDLEKELNQLAKETPGPMGKFEEVALLRKFDLMSGAKLTNLEIGPMMVEAHVKLDKALVKLAKDQKEGIKLALMGEAAMAVAKRWNKEMVTAAEKVDMRISTVIADGEQDKEKRVDKLVKEVTNVLTVARQRCHREMNDAVEKEWGKFVQRKAALKEYRKTIAIGIAAAGVNLAFNAAHIVASMGVTVIGVVSMAKSCADIASATADAMKSIGQVEKDTGECLAKLYKEAVNKQEGFLKDNPHLKKAKMGAKELMAWGSYAAFANTTSYTRADFLIKQYKGQVSQTESALDNLVGKLNKLLDAIKRGEAKLKSAKKSQILDKIEILRVKVVELLSTIGKAMKILKERLKTCGGFDDFFAKLKQFDIYMPKMMKTGEVTMYATTVGGLAWNIGSLATALA